MKRLGTLLSFKANLVSESTSSVMDLGSCDCSMQLWVADAPTDKVEYAEIEWLYSDGNYEDVENIGCWFNNGKLIDYDGVFELPKEAVKLLRQNKFVVPDEFIF